MLSSFQYVATNLRVRAAAAQAATAAVLEATSLMAQDPGLLADVVQRRINAGTGPATAVDQAVEGFCKILEASGPYLAERVTDLRDVRDRIVAKVLGVPGAGHLPPLSKPTIIVATDLAPADTATLDLNHVVGIVTELGGPTSHTAIIAAQLDLPCLVRVAGAMQLADDTEIAIDAAHGTVVLDPDDETARGDPRQGEGTGCPEDRHRRRGPHQGRRTRVQLLANIGAVEDAERAAKEDVEGVGLFRTEVLFLDSGDRAHRRGAGERRTPRCSRRSATARWSSGRWMPARTSHWRSRRARRRRTPHSAFAGIGWTGVFPQLLDDQLTAIAQAAKATGGRSG